MGYKATVVSLLKTGYHLKLINLIFIHYNFVFVRNRRAAGLPLFPFVLNGLLTGYSLCNTRYPGTTSSNQEISIFIHLKFISEGKMKGYRATVLLICSKRATDGLPLEINEFLFSLI